MIRADRTDSQYQTLAAQSQYASVGKILGTTSSYSYAGSGTLIAPNWVLTAGHIVDSAKSLSFIVNGQTYIADRWVAHPLWNGNLSTGYDIALIHLNTAVTGITPAARYTGSSERGATATIVGYGTTGTGLTGGTTYDAKKRAAQNVIDSISNSRVLMMDFDNPTNRRDSYSGSSTPVNLEGLIAPGDSGGAVFITSGGKTYLAGVNSFGASWDGNTNFDYGDLSGHIRVSPFNSWIDSTLGGAVATANTQASGRSARGASAVPEPGTWSLLGAGMLLLGLATRFRNRA